MAHRGQTTNVGRDDDTAPLRVTPKRVWWFGAALFAAVGISLLATRFRSHNPPNERGIAAVKSRAQAPSAEVPLASRPAWQEMDDPDADGWETEARVQQAEKQLKMLGKMPIHADRIELQQLDSLVTDDFSCGPLVPAGLRRVFEDQLYLIERSEPVESVSDTFHGVSGLREAICQLSAELQDAREPRCKFKVIHVETTPDGFTTRQYFSLSGITHQGVVEQHATWLVNWSMPDERQPPRIRRIVVEEFERVRARHADPLFADCTESALAGNPCYQDQLLRGVNHWLERIPVRSMLARFGLAGIAVGDVNGDGLEDLYLCQDPGVPNRLFLQNSDGKLRDVSEAWGVNWLEDSRSALLLDLDNDGDQDLAVAIFGNLVLARNEDQQRFRVQTVLATSESTSSLSAVDFDQDGRLDLYICGYASDKALSESSADAIGAVSNVSYVDSNRGGANKLFRSETTDSEWRFVDVTRQVGLDVNNRRWSFAASWEDYDNDGDPDLYVANDYGRNNLYRNNGGQFVDVAAEMGAEDSASGMSVAWGDYDRDGWMDVYIANMFSAAGNRIISQPNFNPASAAGLPQQFRRFVRGNTLLRNLGQASDSTSDRTMAGFIDEGARARVTMGRWAWGSNFVDLNNDGWEDLVVANGFMTTEDTGDL